MTKSSVPERPAHALDRVVVLGFVLALCVPGVGQLLRGDSAAGVVRENRRPPERPGLSLATWRTFPTRFEAWYRDAHAFRRELLELHAGFAWEVLGQSPSPRMVRGKDDWLFNTDLFALPVHLGARPFTGVELEAWREALEGRRDWLAERGIAYVFVVAPDKTSIYPERLPARIGAGGTTRLDQLLAYLERTSTVTFVDLRPLLIAEKARDREGDHVHYPHGTHWTERGAFAVYRALLPLLGPRFADLPLVPLDGVESEPLDGQGDSWRERLYLTAHIEQHERHLRCTHAESCDQEARAWRTPMEGRIQVDKPHLPRLHLAHDSFAVEVRRWLAHHTSLLTWRWQLDLDLAQIEAERPHAVLQLYGEAILSVTTPGFVAGASGELLRNAFSASSESLHRLFDAAGGPGPYVHGDGALELHAAGLELALESDDHALVLPPMQVPPGARGILRIELEVDAPGSLELRAGAAPEVSGERRHLLRHELQAGRNELYMKVWRLGEDEHLLLRWLPDGGRVRILDLELRAVPAATPDPIPELLQPAPAPFLR